jgi:hypothetical protein
LTSLLAKGRSYRVGYRLLLAAMMGESKSLQATGVAPVLDSPSDSETNGVNAPRLPDRYADESYKLFSKVQVAEPTPEEARIIRNKCLWRILPFLCIGYHLMYVDKQTVCPGPTLSNQKELVSHLFTSEIAREFSYPRNSGRRPSHF